MLCAITATCNSRQPIAALIIWRGLFLSSSDMSVGVSRSSKAEGALSNVQSPVQLSILFLSLRSVFRLAFLFCRPLVVLSLAVVTLGLLGPAATAQNIFNCSSFSTSGKCGLSSVSGGTTDFRSNANALVGTSINLAPAGSGHSGYDVWYQTPVNVQAFTTTFTFVPGCCNVAFVVQNVTSEPPANAYSGGAGAEAGSSQFAGGTILFPTISLLWNLIRIVR